MNRTILVEVTHVRKAFGDGASRRLVMQDFSLTVHRSEFITLFGPNGCGKTTLLNVIAGIETPDEGAIRIHSAPHGKPHAPRIGYVFQDYRGYLMPWLTVAENIAFPLRIKGVREAQRRREAETLQDRFGFQLDLNAHTYTLSGGQAQLASILRALIIDPEILIMDEPFSALDYQTNLDLYQKVLQIWDATNLTILLVSHDIDEALYLGQRTVFLTKRPTSVAAILDSTLPRERDLSAIGTEAFAAMKRQALEIFRREALERASNVDRTGL